MSNILVTGGTGFLGRHLVRRLKGDNNTVHVCNTTTCNLHNYDELRTAFKEECFDYIFHLAAKTKAGDYCLYHKGEQWIDNQLLNTNILKFWVNEQPSAKLIGMGTSCMYEPSDEHLKEEMCMTGDTEAGLYAYAHTKRMLLVGLQSIADQYGLKYIYFIPSTLYGTDFVLNDNHFIFDLIKKIYNGKHHNDDVVLWGDGHQRRELIYIDDVIDIMLLLLHTDNQVINLGTGHDNSIREFAAVVSKVIGFNPSRIIYDESKYTGAQIKTLSPSKLLSLMPDDFSFTSLDDGVKSTIEYYLSARK